MTDTPGRRRSIAHHRRVYLADIDELGQIERCAVQDKLVNERLAATDRRSVLAVMENAHDSPGIKAVHPSFSAVTEQTLR